MTVDVPGMLLSGQWRPPQPMIAELRQLQHDALIAVMSPAHQIRLLRRMKLAWAMAPSTPNSGRAVAAVACCWLLLAS